VTTAISIGDTARLRRIISRGVPVARERQDPCNLSGLNPLYFTSLTSTWACRRKEKITGARRWVVVPVRQCC